MRSLLSDQTERIQLRSILSAEVLHFSKLLMYIQSMCNVNGKYSTYTESIQHNSILSV